MIDVAVIGAGPSGLFSVFMCGMQKLKCHIIDPLPFLGGQCQALYPQKPIYDIPGFPSIRAEELIHRLKEQIQPFAPYCSLNEKVCKITQEKEGAWCLEGDRGTVIEARSVIIAAGLGAFGPHRPPLEDIETFEPDYVHYSVIDPSLYSGKNIVIAGGGDSAVDWGIELSKIAQSVTMVHRRNTFRCHPHSEEELKKKVQEGRINLITPYQLHSLEGENGILKTVTIKSLQNEIKILEADYLLPFFGLSTDLGIIEELTFDKKSIPVDPTTSATALPGLYAVGDVSSYPHKNKLILCGFAEAAQGSAITNQSVK
jgi:thioredoxin reductase (NADPH)